MLSIDIGFKHMVICHTADGTRFGVSLFSVDAKHQFQDIVSSFILHLDAVIKLVTDFDLVVIEQQLPMATDNFALMYLIGGYFIGKGKKTILQRANDKYKRFKGQDERRNKDNAVIYVMENHLKDIQILYRNQEDRQMINHRFYNDDLRGFLQKNKLDKFDDIADAILIALVANGEQ